MVDKSRTGPVPASWLPAIRVGAALVPLAVSALLATVRDSVTPATTVLVLVLVVVGAAATGDRVSGLVAAVSAAVWFDFFLTVPYLRFTIDDADDVETTILLLLISGAVTEIALWGSRQHARAARRAGYLDGVLRAAREVAEGEAPTSAVVDVVARHIAEVLGADSCRFVDGPPRDARIAVLDHDGVVTRNDAPVDVERVGLPTDEYVAVPVRRGQHVAGHFLVSSTDRVTYPSLEDRRIAVLLADQVAVALSAD
jgi:K+-sensing histidine kinase KdpD